MMMERTRLLAEGAGAIATAAILHELVPRHKKIAAIVSGGNIDINLVSRLIDRGLMKTGRMVKIVMSAQDRPGILRDCLGIIASTGANIISISQDRLERDLPIGSVLVEVAVETRTREHIEQVVGNLRQGGFDARIDDHLH
jgi:threonine dehydratase